MMNSAIAANIIGTLAGEQDSLNQKIANSSRSSLLLGNIDFSVTEVKKPTTGSNIPGKYLCKVGENETVCNGQKKQKNFVDQNRNTFNNSYVTLNGNKEKIIDGIPVPKILLYTGKIHLEWKHMYKIGAGLNNLGNTCFMNTVIQCLTYCPPLTNYLLHDNDHSPRCAETGFCMMCILQRHIKKTIGKSGEVVKPLDVYHKLKKIAKHFQIGRQEDAHEFLRYVIDNLWKSCLPQNSNCSKLDAASKETTVINQIFGGYHRSQVTCLRCKEKSNTFDHFMDFILDIKQNVTSLEKALEKFTQPELLEQENSYKCPKCKMKVTAQKKFTVYKAPNVATFQLKRFDYNRSFGGKITKQISYPEKLNLRPFMSEPKGDPVWYRLNAVLVHSGSSCNSGHYYCFVKSSNGSWYIMDDHTVHAVSLPQVLSQGAYVLFYVKADTPQNTSMKKCFENRNPVIKGNNSACNYKRTPEISSVRSSPLTERNQAKQSSPTIKRCLPVNINIKKPPMSPNLNRERISFGIHASMPNIQDIHKLAQMSPAKKVKQSPNISTPNNNSSGLVPYIKDSSESSDENESNRLANPKTETRQLSAVSSLSENTKLDGAKRIIKMSKNFNGNSPKIEIKRKLSKSIMGMNKSLPAISNNSTSTHSKVIATGSWTVTDAPVVSTLPGSSTNSVNSTTGWHVTSANSDFSAETVVNKSNTVSKESDQACLANSSKYTLPMSNAGVNCSPKDTKIISCSNSQESDVNATSYDDHNSSLNSKSPNSKMCDFRKQASPNEKSFLNNDRNSMHQHNSFLKRKCNDSDKKMYESSPEHHFNENGSSFLPKKFKHSEEFSEKPSKNGLDLQNKHVHTSGKYNGSGYEINSMLHQKSSSNDLSFHRHSRAANPFCDKLLDKSEKSKDKQKRRETDNVSSAGSSHSSVEYEWVEKTKDSIENGFPVSLKEKQDKRNGYNTGSSFNGKTDRPQDVVSELTKNSNYFYGASVPTWKGENHYKDSSVNEKRKSLDDYEDEYDRGKVRKFKSKDRYQSYGKQNRFQNYEERRYNHASKYNGNFYYGHRDHHQKPYDSHNKWKQNRNHDYQRNRKYFKPHFRR